MFALNTAEAALKLEWIEAYWNYISQYIMWLQITRPEKHQILLLIPSNCSLNKNSAFKGF